MAVGVRSAMAVDWIALTAGIIGAGVAIIAVMIMLERNTGTAHDCEPHPDTAQQVGTAEPCGQ